MIYLLLWWWNSVRNGLENNVLEGVEGSKEGEKEGAMMEIKEKGRSRASPPTLICRIWSCTLQKFKILSGNNYSKLRMITDLLLAFVLEHHTNRLGPLHRRLSNLKLLRLNQFLIRLSDHCRQMSPVFKFKKKRTYVEMLWMRDEIKTANPAAPWLW